MAKTLIITLALIVIIVLLVIIAAKPPTLVSKPAEQIQITPEQPTPKATVPERGEPTPQAQETKPIPAGVDAQKVYPQEVDFYVNNIRVPESTTYEAGLNYIPIKKHDMKTFAGSFGPYPEDITKNLRVVMCAEFYNMPSTPACELVPILYRGNYISFARGYQSDEYVGGMAAKDYVAYYDVYAGDVAIAHSNRAVIRTVPD